MFEFDKMTTMEVIEIAKNGDQIASGLAYNYIVQKFSGIIHGLIYRGNLFLQGGGERIDLVQDGNIGLYKAIRDYNPEFGSFENFAKVVVLRHLITAIKKATRQKNKPLNEMFSFDKALTDNDNLTMMDIIGFKSEVQAKSNHDQYDPEELLILKETEEKQKEHLYSILSDQEKEVCELYIERKKYPEIMEILNIDNAKKVDNTIQRIKRKYREVLLFDADNIESLDTDKQKII